MHPPKIADHCSRCSGHLVGKQQAKQFQHHVMYPASEEKVEGRGGGVCRNAREKEGGRHGWMRGSERAGRDGSSEAAAVCRGSRPRRAGMSDPTRRILPGERSPLPSRTAEKHRGLQGFPPHKLVSSSCFLPHKISSISSLIALYKQT